MKAEHRHELKTNELADFIAHFPNWCKENLRMIIYVVVVIVLVAGTYFYRAYQEKVVKTNERAICSSLMAELVQAKFTIARHQTQGTDTAVELLSVAEKLENFARNTNKPDMAALAYIKQAEAIRTELHYRFGDIDKQTIDTQIQKAKQAYDNAISQAVDNVSLRSLAVLGKALCDEEAGNFDAAKQTYSKLANDPEYKITPAAASAMHRLKIMDDYSQKVTFNKPIPVVQTPSLLDLDMPKAGSNLDLSIPSIRSANSINFD